MSSAVETLLRRGPGVPEPPDEAIKRVASRGPDMGMKPEQEDASAPSPWPRQWRLRRQTIRRLEGG